MIDGWRVTDGGLMRGGLNMASLYKLPIIFCVENNKVGAGQEGGASFGL